jgi:hypothetical protein
MSEPVNGRPQYFQGLLRGGGQSLAGSVAWERPQKQMRYFIVRLHRLLDPQSQAPQR